MTLLGGHKTFVIEIEHGEKDIEKLKNIYESVTKVRNLRLHFKGKIFRHMLAFTISNPWYKRVIILGTNMSSWVLPNRNLIKIYFSYPYTEDARDVILK